MNAESIFPSKSEFKEVSDNLKISILEGKDKKSTQKATRGAINKLKKYLHVKSLPKLEDIVVVDLPEILFNFYIEIKPKNNEDYAVQTLKCIRTALNRYFKIEKGIDIIKNPEFVRPNEMFKGVCVQRSQEIYRENNIFRPGQNWSIFRSWLHELC